MTPRPRARLTFLALLPALSLGACSGNGCSGSGGGPGGGGGGGGWLVGTSGLMANVHPGGEVSGYDLGATEDLYAIACRFEGEAFVAGAHGTVLYTADGGALWSSLVVPTTHDLRALATQDAGPVFVAGDDTLLESDDAGAHWRELSNGATNFLSIAAAQDGTTVLAIADDGVLWSYDGRALAPRTTIAGARAIAVSPDGAMVIVAGDGVQISRDAGATFAPIAGASGRFESARIDDRGEAIAVGAAGTVANISAGGIALVQHVGTTDLHVVHMQTWGATTSKGYLAGEDGQVYLTTDAGWSWTLGPKLAGPVYGADEIGAGHNEIGCA